jgi:hypothetical protein
MQQVLLRGVLDLSDTWSPARVTYSTQDFITPQDQEFSVQHAHGGDVNKENFRPMRSPCNLSPAARKKPKKTLYPMTGAEAAVSVLGHFSPC